MDRRPIWVPYTRKSEIGDVEPRIKLKREKAETRHLRKLDRCMPCGRNKPSRKKPNKQFDSARCLLGTLVGLSTSNEAGTDP